MSVLIKGMEMPKSCEDCDLCTSDGYCIATGGDSLWDALPEGAEYFPTGWKYEGCPLVEVPVPHGDLIDKSQIKVVELEDSVHLMRWERNSEVDFRIEAPTVIEAEESK